LDQAWSIDIAEAIPVITKGYWSSQIRMPADQARWRLRARLVSDLKQRVLLRGAAFSVEKTRKISGLSQFSVRAERAF
jgi:hypothetical protein